VCHGEDEATAEVDATAEVEATAEAGVPRQGTDGMPGPGRTGRPGGGWDPAPAGDRRCRGIRGGPLDRRPLGRRRGPRRGRSRRWRRPRRPGLDHGRPRAAAEAVVAAEAAAESADHAAESADVAETAAELICPRGTTRIPTWTRRPPSPPASTPAGSRTSRRWPTAREPAAGRRCRCRRCDADHDPGRRHGPGVRGEHRQLQASPGPAPGRDRRVGRVGARRRVHVQRHPPGRCHVPRRDRDAAGLRGPRDGGRRGRPERHRRDPETEG